MRILLSNDDGILAPGIAAMHRELAELGEVTVVAPDSVQSASAHAITINAPLTAVKVQVQQEFYGWAVNGRPADCVKLAIAELMDQPPDLVVSGINDGANVSINVLYSGTVAAAAEGALLGAPSIAVSLERGVELDFARAAMIARELIRCAVDSGLGKGQLLNINIPDLTNGPPKGVRVVTQSVQRMVDGYISREGPDGSVQYFLEGKFDRPGDKIETDLRGLVNGYVVVTPLHFDLTAREQMAQVREWSWDAVRF